MSSRSPPAAEREPTSYHFSSLCAELEALLERVLLLDWLDEYGASVCSGTRNPVGVYGVFTVIKKSAAHST